VASAIDAKPATASEVPPFAGAPARGAPTYRGLQYLRAIGALLVVYYHAVLQVQDVYDFRDWPLVGRSGVDIFFVLSGFVMWTSTSGSRASPGLFLRRRIARIVPLYWAVTIGASLIALVVPQLLRSTSFDIPLLISSLLFVPWPNPLAVARDLPEYIVPVIVPGWTLNFEMLFYLLFAVGMGVPRQWRLGVLAALVTGAFVLASLLRDTAAIPEFYAQAIIFEFLGGVLIAAWFERRPALPTAAAMVALIVGFLWLLLADEIRPDIDRFLALGPPAMLIVAATVSLERHGRVPKFRLPDELGNASYSIYLIHIYIIAALRIALGVVVRDPSPAMVASFVVLSVVASGGIGILAYRWFEIPAVAAAKRLLRA
jgi:exopolysaccharide production protein ExoZ